MSIFLRGVLLLKVLVLLTLGTASAAWAECQEHEEQASNGHGVYSALMIAAEEDDDSTTDDPDTEEDEGDSQT
ncbi:hypothetical protein [Pseudomonas fluorescens]|uniref:Secreted protein n=1 Tax=Pseudomonas fluorescens TaxID=294 RepID=A0A5E7FF69_PSEFL|nr:hypothetical protein [Pseudomonas fluorescens]VVO37909.1 hypothetical protein PS691_05471 [Pseudomonas fluorescens]